MGSRTECLYSRPANLIAEKTLTLQATARFIARDSADHAPLRAHYLAQRPKAKLYIDFADFRLVRFDVAGALLNGGFGRAYKLAPSDLDHR